ncbi:mRNA-capping enzyme subunit beta [Serendipita sp. 411]|nr:mRNA-capping enzyme subunit beta [Serendipita sp. 411]
MAHNTNGGSINAPASGQTNPYSSPLEPSFLNKEPQDEFVKEVADWIAYVSQGRNDIEIEAKFGVVLDKSTGTRVAPRLGVLVETIVDPREATNMRFESKLSARQHEHLNRMLNDQVTRTVSSSYPHARMAFRHQQTTDDFFSQDSDSKFRVSRDTKTGQVVECIIKKRLGDLHVISPKREVDWRISVNTEEKVDVRSTEGTRPYYSRRKDRMEYMHQHFRIDLTQVTDQANVQVRASHSRKDEQSENLLSF